jgi:flagella basal body P-ring formation protein FlgA
MAGTSVIAVATIHAVTDYAITRRALARNETISPIDIAPVRDELVGAPLRRLPTAGELVGGRVLRPLPAGVSVLPGSVIVRRSIEPGDHVVVVALSGSIEVAAEMVAADGGRVGDVVRAVNPATHQYVRGRVIESGRLEVIHAQ